MAAPAPAKQKKQALAEIVERLRQDFAVYAEYNLRIIDKDGEIVKLSLNRMQRYLLKVILSLIIAGKPIRIYLVKGRQLGSTTFFTAFLYWLATMNKHKRVIAIAHDDEASENIGLRWQNYYWSSYKPLRPKFRKMNAKQIYFATPLKEMKNEADVGLDSLMMVKTADSASLGRSWTFNGALLTEFCIWPQLGIDVKKRMIALHNAIPKRRNTAVFIESSPQGDNYGKTFWDDLKNGYIKIFVSWLAEDEYRTRLRKSDYFELSEVEDSRYGNELVERSKVLVELKKWYPAEEFGANTFPDEASFKTYAGWLHHEVYCRLQWRRETIDGPECQGDKDEFKKEYPTCVEDGFGARSKSVFGPIELLRIRDYIRTHEIKPRLKAYHHDDKDEEYYYDSKLGTLRIFEEPQEGAVYVIGADAAQGVPDGDDSSFVVLKLPNGSGPLVEVASFNDIIQPTEFAGALYCIQKYYNNALLGVEREYKAGHAVIDVLRKVYRCPNLYWFKNPNKKPDAKQEIVWGWRTTEVTRPIMISNMMDWVKNRDIIINSEKIVSQMDTFCENPKTGKIEATPGSHDDLVLALLVAGQMTKCIHIRKPKEQQKLQEGTVLWWKKKQQELQRRRGIRVPSREHRYGRRKRYAA